MDITGKLRKAVCSQDLTENKIFTVLEAADEIEKLREALLHIAWGGYNPWMMLKNMPVKY